MLFLLFPHFWCGKSFCINEPIVILELGGNKNLQQEELQQELTTRICFFIHQLLSAAFLYEKKFLSKAKAMGFKSKLMKFSLKIWKQLEQCFSRE